MYNIILFLLFCSQFTFGKNLNRVDISSNKFSNITDFEFEWIGDFDDISYFVERVHVPTAAMAKKRCETLYPGMHLVTPTSRIQFDWIIEHIQFGQRHWTSGQNAGIFKWDHGKGELVDETVVDMSPIELTNCLVLHGRKLVVDPCDGIPSRTYFTLCELPFYSK